MKKNRIFGYASAAALLLSVGACSSDLVEPGNSQTPGISAENAGGLYLSVDFKMPTGLEGTRSETVGEAGQSSGGNEVGSAAENAVSSALIVLASSVDDTDANIQKFGFIAAGEVPSNRIATAGNEANKMYKATARLQKENIERLYSVYEKTDENGNVTSSVPDVYVFVFCNPTSDLVEMFDKARFGSADWTDETCEVIQTVNGLNKNIGIWSANSFLMNNVSLATRGLPQRLIDWEFFSSVESPFHLSDDNTWEGNNQVNNSAEFNNRGAVTVERSVARFDFKDGSPTSTPANTYVVLLNTDEDGDYVEAQPVVDVELQKMCLVNMSNKFYYLPRVSENGLPNNFTLCGREKEWYRDANGEYSGGNYVVGPYATQFSGTITNDFSDYFNFPFFENNGTFNNNAMSTTRWDVVNIDDVLKGTQDNYVTAEGTTNNYRVWRYVTENVIPAPTDNQVNGISTGVVFKGQLKGNSKAVTGEGYYEANWDEGAIQNLANCLNGEEFTFNGKTTTLQGNSTNDPILYYFNGHLYMGWRHLRQAAIQASITINTAGEVEINPSNSLYKAVFGNGPIPPSYSTGNPYYYVDADGNHHNIVDPRWDSTWKSDGTSEVTGENAELYAAYKESANFAWSVWSDDGRSEIIEDNDEVSVSPTLIAMRKAVTGAGISIYQSSVDNVKGAGYYCYYYYWNRHNDNGRNGNMGPMEFDVVRNNVYKLSVDKIARLGHPRIPENDPNNPTPEDPDESDEIYLDVKMEIVPWVVRLNSIVF